MGLTEKRFRARLRQLKANLEAAKNMPLEVLIAKVVARIRGKRITGIIGATWNVGQGLMDYYLNPSAKKQSELPKQNYEKIRADMENAGLQVIPYRIDVADFYKWLDKAAFPKEYIDSYGTKFVEKALEHYLGAKLLELGGREDVMIDIAAASSPWFEIAERMYGCKAYALDLSFPEGINEKKIGADATATPLPDGFATKIALHCAYEMFEGDADIRLIPEAERVLAPGGRMIILPLYMHNFYFADSSPLADRRGLDYQGAVRVWRDDVHNVRFSRKYSVNAFIERVVKHLGSLSLTIYFIENEKEVDPICYCKFVAVFQK